MKVYKIKHFAKWANEVGLTDAVLCAGVEEMTRGLIDADLGGGVVKKRIALPGMGKSGGARTLLATNFGNVWIFLVGFTKGERDNISSKELAALKMLSADWLALAPKSIALAVTQNRLIEVKGL